MKLGRDTLGVFTTNAFNVVLSLGNSIFLTRVLGVEGRGEFAVFAAALGLLALVLGFGLDVSVRYFVARGDVPRERILTSLVLWVGAASLLVFAAARANDVWFGSELFLPASRQTPLYEGVLAAAVGFTLLFGNISSVFAGMRSFGVINAMTLFSTALAMAVYGGMFFLERAGRADLGSGQVFVAYMALQAASAGILVWLGYRRLGLRFSASFLDGALLAAMVRYAAKAYGANLAQFLNYRADIWIVQFFLGSVALGLYSLAAGLVMMLWILPRATATVLLPAVAAEEEGVGFAEAARLARVVLAVTVAGAVALAVTAAWWIPLLYGRDFAPSAGAFAVLLVGGAPFALSIVLASVLAGVDRVGLNLAGSLVGLVVTVALDLLLIPRYGIAGAAWASSASYLATTAVAVAAFSRVGGIAPLRCMLVRPADFAFVWRGLKGLPR
ncbi:MAG: polysaccharide biosynthesis C-terminal domain-containing protein [Gemmatimonadota bacterium]